MTQFVTQLDIARRGAALAALAVAFAAPVSFAQSTGGQDGMQAPVPQSGQMDDKAKMKEEAAKQRAARSDTSANRIKELEDKQAADAAKDKGQVEEEEEDNKSAP